MIRNVTNLTAVSSLMGGFIAEAVTRKFLIKDQQKRLQFNIENTAKYCRHAMNVLGFDIELIGFDAERLRNNNYLFVSNHMSYLDVLITCAVKPMVFVTSVDMGETPFLGDLAAFSGSIFVERRHRGAVDRDLGVMTETLKTGFNVMIYPEGTSTDGSHILPFKKSLLMSAVQAGKDIQPLCLQYLEIDGEPFSPKNAGKVCWYGDMTFTPHFLQLMKMRKVRAALHFLDPISVREDSTRDELAKKSYSAIAAQYFGADSSKIIMPKRNSEPLRAHQA